MKLIKIENTKLFAIIDDEDFSKVNSYEWYLHSSGYAKKTLKTTVIYMHRLILNVYNKKEQIDHIDGNKLNNQKDNLRICNNAENNRNTGIRKTNKSGYKGVSWKSSHKTWIARITVNYKALFLGHFKNKEDAGRAYNEAALKYFGEFAQLNIIKEKE